MGLPAFDKRITQLFICFFVLDFIWSVQGIFVQSSGIFGEQHCTFDPAENSKWCACICENLDGEGNTHVKCRRRPWTTIPVIPYDNRSTSHNDTVINLVALSIVESSLSFIAQDAFKHHSIQILDLTSNYIETINVNAFRGLENKLYQLTLSQNSLNAIPSYALTYLHQLQYLHLEHNIIAEVKSSTFNETQLRNLHYLHLDFNQISILPKNSLLRLPLQVLTISNNRLVEIEKLALPSSIWFLDMKNNVVQEIPYLALRELNNLRTLDLEGNNITEIDNNPEVEFTSEMDLILSNNRIKHINDDALSSFQKFNRLVLSYNQISTISARAFNTISQLRHIDLSYNKLVHISAGMFGNVAKSVRWMNLEENQLHTMPNALKPLRTLEFLNMNGNKLIALDNNTVNNMKPALSELLLAFNRLTEIPSQALNGMSKLRHLDLSKNRIRMINRLAFGTFDGTGMNLVKLNLAGNLIENITDPGAFLYLSSLAHLDLSHNRINYLSDAVFERLERLESLFLQNNQLRLFPRHALINLQRLRYLLLDDNPIMSLPNSALSELRYLERLSLSRTRITSINDRIFHPETSPNLRSLNIAFSQIRHISSLAFHKLESLEQLLIDNNRLTAINTLTFSSMRNLRQLSLAGNEINSTSERSISEIPNLEQLSLAHNRLTYLQQATFVNLNNLQSLDLSYNYLHTFDFTFLAQSLINLKQLDLSHNRLVTINLNSAKRTLTYLNIGHNQLQSIGKNMIDNFNELRILQLDHNELIEVQSNAFNKCPKLTSLDLSNNHLRILHKGTFASQESYTNLNLGYNAINSLDANTFGRDNVFKLDLSCNELKKVPHYALLSIRDSISVLSLRANRLRMIDSKDFQGMSNLTELILADNHIETIEEAAFASMPKLLTLDISHNPIISWNPHAFQDLSNAIETLNLASTGLFSLPRIDNRGLRHLNISHNKVHELSSADITNHRKLSTLDISYNNFNELDPKIFEDLVELKHLNICGNPITRITEKHIEPLYRLETLKICNMKNLISLPDPNLFGKLRHLRNFYMYDLPHVRAYNASEVLKNLPPLRTLAIEIKETRLSTQLYSADMRLLRNILITGKQLVKIDTGAFAQLRGYRIEIRIRDTALEHFSASIFNTLTAVSFLSLAITNSRLQTFQPFPYTKPPLLNQHGTILHDLNLAGNPIICDCRLQWVREWTDYYRSVNAPYEEPLSDTYCDAHAGEDVTIYKAFKQPDRFPCNQDSFKTDAACIKRMPGTLFYIFLAFVYSLLTSIPLLSSVNAFMFSLQIILLLNFF